VNFDDSSGGVQDPLQLVSRSSRRRVREQCVDVIYPTGHEHVDECRLCSCSLAIDAVDAVKKHLALTVVTCFSSPRSDVNRSPSTRTASAAFTVLDPSVRVGLKAQLGNLRRLYLVPPHISLIFSALSTRFCTAHSRAQKLLTCHFLLWGMDSPDVDPLHPMRDCKSVAPPQTASRSVKPFLQGS